MDELLARAWRAAGPLQGWLAWLLHPTFDVGVTGVVRSDDGRLLLVKHRLWPEEQQWGFPGGFAKRGEQFTETVVREVREETGLTVRAPLSRSGSATGTGPRCTTRRSSSAASRISRSSIARSSRPGCSPSTRCRPMPPLHASSPGAARPGTGKCQVPGKVSAIWARRGHRSPCED